MSCDGCKNGCIISINDMFIQEFDKNSLGIGYKDGESMGYDKDKFYLKLKEWFDDEF